MSEFGDTHPEWAPAHERALAAFVRRTKLGPADAEQLRLSITQTERYPAAAVMNTSGPGLRLKCILSGWACEMRALPDRRRQIFSFILPGDVVLVRPARVRNPCCVLAVTRVDCVDFGALLRSLDEAQAERIGAAIDSALLCTHERRYEHIVRLGRQSATERVAHLILDLRSRLAEVGLVDQDHFRLPLTQEHMADALGLSIVHVNRTLKRLRAEGLLEVKFGSVTVLRPDDLAEVGRISLAPA